METLPILNESWVLTTLCVLLPFIVYFVNARIVPYFRPRSRNRDFTGCDSSECVRCSKYQVIRSQAFAKLSKFAGERNILVGLERMFQAVENTDKEDEHPGQRPNVVYVPGLKALPWWDKEAFQDDINILEQNVEIIHNEYITINKDLMEWNVLGWAQNNTQRGQWNVYYFYNQGVKIEANCTQCPQTSSILDKLKNVMKGSLFLNVSYSVLHAGTTIDEHYGPTNARIRCHLGLEVPDRCSLTVSDDNKSWERGKCLIFDDSFLHSAQNGNRNQTNRVVLLLDFWHPQLTNLEREVLIYVF